MRITITARHIEVPDSFEELLRGKIQKLERFGHPLIACHAILGKEKYLYTAELNLSAKGSTLVGKAKDGRDLLTCTETALMRLEEQLRRHESKRVDRLRRRTQHRR